MKKTTVLIFLALLFVYTAGLCEENLLGKARSLINEKKYEDAISVLQRAQSESPNSIEINTMLGLLSLEQERYFIAEDCFLRILRVDSKSLSAHYSLGLIYEKNKRYFEAIHEWEDVNNLAREQNPNDKQLLEFAERHIKFCKSQLK